MRDIFNLVCTILFLLFLVFVVTPLISNTLPGGAAHNAINRALGDAPYATPQPDNADPPQWSNEYWEAKAATREAHNAQYRTP